MLRTGFDNAGALSLGDMGGRVRSYYEKVMGYGPLVCFPQWEGIGLVSQELIHGWDGTYQGITWNPADTGPDGYQVPFYDGVNDFDNVWTAALTAAFNGGEGTLALWARVANVGVWTDGAARIASLLWVNGNNYILVYKPLNNTLTWIYRAGGISATRNTAGLADVNFMHLAFTWSATANQVVAYLNGAQQGAIMAIPGVWAGALTAALFGSNTPPPANQWHGWLAHGAVWTRALAPAEIADLATV